MKVDFIHQIPEHHICFDVFSAGSNLDVKLLVDKSKLYEQQNNREFQTNKQEMRAFLGTNYIMFIDKLPIEKLY